MQLEDEQENYTSKMNYKYQTPVLGKTLRSSLIKCQMLAKIPTFHSNICLIGLLKNILSAFMITRDKHYMSIHLNIEDELSTSIRVYSLSSIFFLMSFNIISDAIQLVFGNIKIHKYRIRSLVYTRKRLEAHSSTTACMSEKICFIRITQLNAKSIITLKNKNSHIHTHSLMYYCASVGKLMSLHLT